jgi:hypothetical protein
MGGNQEGPKARKLWRFDEVGTAGWTVRTKGYKAGAYLEATEIVSKHFTFVARMLQTMKRQNQLTIWLYEGYLRSLNTLYA